MYTVMNKSYQKIRDYLLSWNAPYTVFLFTLIKTPEKFCYLEMYGQLSSKILHPPAQPYGLSTLLQTPAHSHALLHTPAHSQAPPHSHTPASSRTLPHPPSLSSTLPHTPTLRHTPMHTAILKCTLFYFTLITNPEKSCYLEMHSCTKRGSNLKNFLHTKSI